MTREHAEKIARCLENAKAHYSGGDWWVVVIKRTDGKVTILGDNGIGIYPSEFDFAEEFVGWPGWRITR